ncbi:MAG: DUF1273 domain-containing protein [Alistipes sp.]|nr:DUF1273 domain-containing protein [Alistipes sp.]
MIADPATCAAFTGHRTYDGSADEALRRTIADLRARGLRTFLSGMAVGFDLAAAEAVLACRSDMPDLRLIAVVPFRGQESRFPPTERERYRQILAQADRTVVLAPTYHTGCYLVRNDYLVGHAATLVAWYDGSPGGTRYTVQRALRRGLEFIQLHRNAPAPEARDQRLF